MQRNDTTVFFLFGCAVVSFRCIIVDMQRNDTTVF